MIDELETLVDEFPGEANLVRCFNHILALVAKTAVRQFDVPKDKADAALDDAEKELRTLAEGTDLDDLQMQIDALQEQLASGECDESEDDDPDSWENERFRLSETDRAALDASIRPVKLLLVKVRSNTML